MKFQIQRFPSLDSTNTYMKGLAKQGAPEGTVVVAEHQTGGRGKLQNKWISEPGKNLLFTLLIRPQLHSSEAPMLTQISCRSVATVLKNIYQIETTFKRPNDILQHGKKLCGILVESSSGAQGVLDYAMIGIGLNVHSYPMGEGLNATSMNDKTRNQFDLNLLLNNILEQIGKDLETLTHHPA